MAFHTEADLRDLGTKIAWQAECAQTRENSTNSAKNGAWGSSLPTNAFYKSYPDLYAAFATPDPAALQPVLDNLASVSFALTHSYPVNAPVGSNIASPDPQKISDWANQPTPNTVMQNLKDHTNDWHGSAKEAFASKVVNSYSETLNNQVAVINALAASLAMLMNLRNTLNDDVWKIGQQSLQNFEKAGVTTAGDAFQFTLACASAAFAVWSVWSGVVTAEEGVVAGLKATAPKDYLSVVSGFNGIGKEENSEVSIKQGGSSDVDSSMQQSLSTAATAYRNQEKQIATAMNQLCAGLKGDSTAKLFQISLPADVEALKNDNDTKSLQNAMST